MQGFTYCHNLIIAKANFSSFCYFIEVDQGSGFTSIPAGFYWVVVTMTTVILIVNCINLMIYLMLLDAT